MAQQGQARAGLPDYVPVAERIADFYEDHPQGRILTSIVEHDAERGFILMKAEVYRAVDDAFPSATGHAFEVRGEGVVNKTSYIENCETGCVGRAISNLGYETKRGKQRPAPVNRPSPLSDDPLPTTKAAPVASSEPTMVSRALNLVRINAVKKTDDNTYSVTDAGGIFDVYRTSLGIECSCPDYQKQAGIDSKYKCIHKLAVGEYNKLKAEIDGKAAAEQAR